MPIFDFHCRRCDRTVELLVSVATVPACPECGSEGMEKLPSLTAPQGKTAGLIARTRAQAAREGHFSNYAASECPRIKP